MTITNFQEIAWSIDDAVDQVGGSQQITWALGISPESVQLYLVGAPSGLTGVLTVAIVTLDGSVYVYGPTTTEIVESPAGTGRYIATVPRPDIGHYVVVWSDGVTAAPPVGLTVFGDVIVTPPLRAVAVGRYELKTGDTEPLLVRLVNDDFIPIDLSFVIDAMTTIQTPNGLEITRSAVIVDEDDGLIMHTWTDATETAAAGVYRAEWELLLADNTVATVPSMGAFQFYVSETV